MKKGNAEEMAKLIEVQRGQDGAVLATASDAALNDAKPVPVMDVAEVVALEQRIAQEGTSLYTLMTRAGKAVAEAVRQHAPVSSHIVVLVGSGNNGGDGWVAAEDLAEQGYDVALVTKAPAAEIKAEPAKTAALKAEEAALFRIEVDPGLDAIKEALDRADVVVDAILGTGFSHSEVREPYASWIVLANEVCGRKSECSDKGADEVAWLIAVDCPSGLNAQTGTPAQACIRADETITMLAVKKGLLVPEAAPYVGQLRLALLESE